MSLGDMSYSDPVYVPHFCLLPVCREVSTCVPPHPINDGIVAKQPWANPLEAVSQITFPRGSCADGYRLHQREKRLTQC